MPTEYDGIWDAVYEKLESLDCGDLMDRLSKERGEEGQRHEFVMKQLRNKTIEECAKCVGEEKVGSRRSEWIADRIRALKEEDNTEAV